MCVDNNFPHDLSGIKISLRHYAQLYADEDYVQPRDTTGHHGTPRHNGDDDNDDVERDDDNYDVERAHVKVYQRMFA